MQASVTCANTGPIVIKDPKKIRGTSGEDVFSEKKGLGFIKNKVNLCHVLAGFYLTIATMSMQAGKL